MSNEKWNNRSFKTTTLRATAKNYARVKNEAQIQGKNITELTNEIIDQYFYNKENQIDNTLETYIFEQMQKVDKHLSSIAIKNARDTCTVLSALLMLIKNTSKSVIDKNELEEQIVLIGRQYFDKHWGYKKD